MSSSESKLERKIYNSIYVHGKDHRRIKFQRKLHRRHSLARVVIFNTIFILLLILFFWILANIIM